MDERKYIKKMEEYNNIAHKNKCIYRAEALANIVSSIMFVLFLIPFISKMFILSGKFGSFFISTEKAREIIIKASDFLSYLNADIPIEQFIGYTLIYLFAIPILAGLIVYVLIRIIYSKSSPTPLSDNLDENIQKLDSVPSKYGYSATLPLKSIYGRFNSFVKYTSVFMILIFLVSLSIWDTIELYKDEPFEMLPVIFSFVFEVIVEMVGIIICFGIATFLLSVLFFKIQKITVLSHSQHNGFYSAQDEYEKACVAIWKERDAEAEAKAKYEKEQRALRAENGFKTLNIDGNENAHLISKLADEGSISASIYMGKKLYEQYKNEALTDSEKEKLAERIIKYFEAAAVNDNIEADFLLLSIRTDSESNTLNVWEEYLQEARRIKSTNMLPQDYDEQVDTLIEELISVINRTERLIEDRKRSMDDYYLEHLEFKRRQQEAKLKNIKEDSIYYDYRTGERLKRTYDGKIVNSNGDEVCECWWE